VRGGSNTNTGVYGIAGGAGPYLQVAGVTGTSTDRLGVLGSSNTESGVFGVSAGLGPGLGPRAGVAGTSTDKYGVLGTSSSNVGVYALSTSRAGVLGKTGSVADPIDPASGGPLIAGVVGAGQMRPGIVARSEQQSAIYAFCMAPAGPGAFECIAPNTYAVVATSTNYSAVVGTTRGAGYGVAGVAAGASSTAAVFGRVDPRPGRGCTRGCSRATCW
jgi:hypothetical protein